MFPQQELGTFLSLSGRDRETQLAELSALVTGIRLFNKFLRKGGEGIDDRESTLRYHGYQTSSSGGTQSGVDLTSE